MTMTKNSKISNISKQAHSSFSIAEYEIMLFCTAMNFLKCNNFHFDDKDISDIKKFFIEDIDRYKNLLHNIEKVDVLYIMFDVMCGCKDFGGDFHMIDALYNKLGEYLEANYKD